MNTLPTGYATIKIASEYIICRGKILFKHVEERTNFTSDTPAEYIYELLQCYYNANKGHYEVS